MFLQLFYIWYGEFTSTEKLSHWRRFKKSLKRADTHRKSLLIRYFFDVNVLSLHIIETKATGREGVVCCQTLLFIPALGCPIHHYGER